MAGSQSPPTRFPGWPGVAASPTEPRAWQRVIPPEPAADGTAPVPTYPQPMVAKDSRGVLSTVAGRHAAQPEPERYDWSQYLMVPSRPTYKADLTWSPQHWPLIADDLWRIAHEDLNGARRANSRVIGLGLAGALLCELVLAGQIHLTPDALWLTEKVQEALASPAAVSARERFGASSLLPDRIADELLTVILGEAEPLPVETWLEYLASRATEKVVRRLLDANHVTKKSSRFGLRREATYQPVDQTAAAWPAARLLTPLRQRTAPDYVDMVLLGLCRETGLHRWLFAGQPSAEVARLLSLPDGLPAPFPLLWERLDSLVSSSASSLR